jgi:hypothetical protein
MLLKVKINSNKIEKQVYNQRIFALKNFIKKTLDATKMLSILLSKLDTT